MGIVSLITAILKALPILSKWIDQAMAAYLKMQIEHHDKDFIEAARILISEHDQRALEKAAGSPSADKPAANQDEIRTRPNK